MWMFTTKDSISGTWLLYEGSGLFVCDGKTQLVGKGMAVCCNWDTHASEIKQNQMLAVFVCVLASSHVQHLVDTICPICGFCRADNSHYAPLPPCSYNLTIPKIIRGVEVKNNLRKWKTKQLLWMSVIRADKMCILLAVGARFENIIYNRFLTSREDISFLPNTSQMAIVWQNTAISTRCSTEIRYE